MLLSALLSAKAVAVVGAGVVVLSGATTAAAYAGVLPASLQTVAHDTVGAPDPSQSADPSESPEPSDSASPSESADPTKSADASKSADPTKSAGPTKSADPSESLDPTDSATPSDSTSPGGPNVPSPSESPKGPDATGPAAFGLCNAYAHGGLPQNSTAYRALLAAAGTGTVDAYCATIPHPGHHHGQHGDAGKHGNAGKHGKHGKHHSRTQVSPSPRSSDSRTPFGAPSAPAG